MLRQPRVANDPATASRESAPPIRDAVPAGFDLDGFLDLAAPVQAKGDLAGTDVQARAAAGLDGASAPLPHLDTIQRAFGRHDVTHVRAQVGGPAAAASASLGARAYASGTGIAFAADPDLHLAAHEAAHVVQQQRGVQLSGGVGASGDVYERHADAVANLVVGGANAESLLDTMAGSGSVTSAVQRADAAGISQHDADAALEVAAFYMSMYGRVMKKESAPLALAGPVDDIYRACASAEPDVEARARRLDAGVSALASARAIASPARIHELDAAIAVVHEHFTDERIGGGAASPDPLVDVMATRAKVARVGAIGAQVAELVTLSNTKRLLALNKAVDWSVLGQVLAQNEQLISVDASGNWKSAFGALEGASFEIGFQLIDAGLTAAIAEQSLGDRKLVTSKQPADRAKVVKAATDLSAAIFKAIAQTGRAVAAAYMEISGPGELAGWKTAFDNFSTAAKMLGDTGTILTSGADIVTNTLVLCREHHGLKAADAAIGIEGSLVNILASGSKLLLSSGIFKAPPGLFSAFTMEALLGDVAAIATPLGVIIPAAWLGTKLLLLEVDKLSVQITGALMAQGFQSLIDGSNLLAAEGSALGVAVSSAMAPNADPATMKAVLDARVDLVRRYAAALQTAGTNAKGLVIRREVDTLFATTGIMSKALPGDLALAVRAVLAGITDILERSPELVAEEARDPSLAERARTRGGTPAPQHDDAGDGEGSDDADDAP